MLLFLSRCFVFVIFTFLRLDIEYFRMYVGCPPGADVVQALEEVIGRVRGPSVHVLVVRIGPTNGFPGERDCVLQMRERRKRFCGFFL